MPTAAKEHSNQRTTSVRDISNTKVSLYQVMESTEIKAQLGQEQVQIRDN